MVRHQHLFVVVGLVERFEAEVEFADERVVQALAVRADVTNAADRAALLQTVADRFGRLDVLVNNAGTFEERNYAAGKNPNASPRGSLWSRPLARLPTAR